jgi:hypothetical protein
LRSRRAGLKRIGLLAIALVLALGALGVAYAAWSDTITVTGTVYTGTIGFDIRGVSSTYVYKVPDAEDTGYGPETVVDYHCSTEGDYTPPANAMPVAAAIAVDTSHQAEDPVTHELIDIWSAAMTFIGVFPGIDFMADVELHYMGTVPGKISLAEITPTEGSDPDEAAILQELWDLGMNGDTLHDPHTEGIWLDAELSTDGGDSWVDVPNPADPDLELLGLELEQGDRVRIHMHVLLPEDPAYEHLSLNFSGQINTIPWYNEES